MYKAVSGVQKYVPLLMIKRPGVRTIRRIRSVDLQDAGWNRSNKWDIKKESKTIMRQGLKKRRNAEHNFNARLKRN